MTFNYFPEHVDIMYIYLVQRSILRICQRRALTLSWHNNSVINTAHQILFFFFHVLQMKSITNLVTIISILFLNVNTINLFNSNCLIKTKTNIADAVY